jgi:hypothetical protein
MEIYSSDMSRYKKDLIDLKMKSENERMILKNEIENQMKKQ